MSLTLEMYGLHDVDFDTKKDADYLTNPAKQAEVREYKRQIDALVYKLYDLTPEEIRIVGNSKTT